MFSGIFRIDDKELAMSLGIATTGFAHGRGTADGQLISCSKLESDPDSDREVAQ